MSDERLGAVGPGEHVCFAYRTDDEFRAAAEAFLAVGEARNERTLLLTSDILDEMYATGSEWSPDAQVRVFEAAAAEARAAGFSGLRVVADCDSLVADPQRYEQFARYEHLVDGFMRRSRAATGMCAYDAGALDPGDLAELVALHRTSNLEPAPFHLSAGEVEQRLVLRGELDASTLETFTRVLSRITPPSGSRVTLDLRDAAFIDHRSLAALEAFARSFDGTVVLEGGPARVALLTDHLALERVSVGEAA